ncbi:hypothetical protein IKF92_01810 [Candidatus Saccharibacteria bacterium]|nr:hypothetical protein [Candidatus Saccharibacteria bacterium]
MAKEIAIGKRAKISEAQQYMLFAVFGASVFLGVAISLVSNFINQISFNTKIIMSEEESIKSYSDFIKTTGVCKSPSGDVYSREELDRCNPDDIGIAELGGTLRANILQNLAANKALNSVPKENDSRCVKDGKRLTYGQLIDNYQNAKGTEELAAASQLIKTCSALRIIPDALPSSKNDEALLAGLNKIFNLSGWKPESLSPSGGSSSSEEESNTEGLNPISVNLSIEANTSSTMNVLNNIEHSIREFNIESAIIEWGSNDSLKLQAQATAYYVNSANVNESSEEIKAGEGQ